jgi:thiamine pyrophosphokinase
METILIFAGSETPQFEINEELPHPDLVVAADSGYDYAVELGFRVDVLIGDMDSISVTDIPDHVIVERHPSDKDTSDLDLALALVARDNPERVVIVGGAGGRLDHELSTANLICSDRWHRIDEIDWVSNRGWSYVVRGRRIIHGDIGATLSLISMGGDVTGVHTKGLNWDLDGDTILFGSTRGLSNIMRGPVADIRIGSGCLLVTIPSGAQAFEDGGMEG